jgi:hypothetical protein
MRRFSPALCVALLCLFSAAVRSSADDLDYVSFEGIVIDANNAAIANARVIAHHITTAHERAVKTDSEGRYRLTKLAPGTYALHVEATGFQTLKYENLETSAGTNVRRDFKISLASVEEQVTIDAAIDPVLIDTSRTVVGGTITRAQIEQLPVESRNPLDLVYILPSVTPPPFSDRDLVEGENRNSFRRTPEEAGIFSLIGGTPFSNNITIEGLDNNDDRAARERFVPSPQAVEEVQVITNQFSAEYGRASGGRVNLRLRSGANRYRGQAFYYFRDESLNANGFRRNADPRRGFRIPYQNQNPGVSFGGPIKKEKLFFFATYEYDFIYDRAEIITLLPTATNSAFPLPRPNGTDLGSTALDELGRTVAVNGGAAVGLYDETVTTPRAAHTWQTRSDWNESNNHTLFAIYTLARNRDERGFSGGRRTLDTLQSIGRNSQSIALGDNLVISPRAVNNLRFQFSRLTPSDISPLNNPVIIIDIDDPRDIRSVPGVSGTPPANPFTRSGTLTAGASTLSGSERREDRYQVQETLNYVRGAHTLRFGGDVQNIRSRFVDLEDTTGVFRFASVADFLAGRPSRYEHRFDTEAEQRNTYTGIFVQDDWRARPNLTFSFGLRWDNETILRDRNNFGPRVSFAWDPFKSAKTTVRAGYGIFYSRALLRTLDDYTLTSNTVRIDTNNEAARPLLAALRFPQPLAANDPRVRQLGVPEAGFLRRLGDDFRIPESYQASLGLEREIARGFKIEINYVFNRGLHLWREINANAPRLPVGFNDFAAYLTSRDFDNSLDPATGQRPLTQTDNADIVRFNLSDVRSVTMRQNNRTIITFGLNDQSVARNVGSLAAALRAVRNLRPNPALTQIEELQARGNSYYHGVSVEMQRRFAKRGHVRANYTLSKLIDDGVLNDSSPLRVGDFRSERASSLLDARHRIAMSGHYEMPSLLGRVALAGILNLSSARPFTIGTSGQDRNLDDVDNDRPNFSGDLDAIKWRRFGDPLNQTLADAFTLPAMGTTGNLPRNAGRGPGIYTLNLRASRGFNLAERRRLELQIEAFNPFNATVFNFGAEFVDFAPNSLANFLVPARTVKPRTMRLGLKLEF